MTDRFILGKQGKALIDAALAGPLEVSLEGALHFGTGALARTATTRGNREGARAIFGRREPRLTGE